MPYYILLTILLIAFTLYTIPFKTLVDSKASKWGSDNNEIYLTFDDGPNRKITPFILDQLKIYNQKATFFLIPGYITQDNQHIVKRIYQEGHTIGLHGKSRFLAFHSANFLKNYVNAFNRHISDIIGNNINVKYFRPPSLWRSFWLYSQLKTLGVILIGVSPFCWLDQYTKNPEIIFNRFRRNLNHGSIYIIHDGMAKYYEPKMNELKIALPKILNYLQNKNLKSIEL